MKKRSEPAVLNFSLKNILVVLFFTFALCFLARLVDSGSGEGTWYSILPPVLAVGLALLTRKIFLSLMIAVFSGGMLATFYTNSASHNYFTQGPNYLWGSVSDSTNLQILLFVVVVLSMITVLIRSGGLRALILFLAKFAKGPRSTQIVTALSGFLLFIDDYANTMFIGSTMRPITDENRISREKLAFLVDATSAPVAGLAIVSTWIGYEVGLFGKAAEGLGIPLDGYAIFIDALSFRFYCILMILFVLINVLTGRDFGLMKKAQDRAREKGQLLDPSSQPMTSWAYQKIEAHPQAKLSVLTAILPIGAIFIYLLAGLWLDGGGAGFYAQDRSAFLSFSVWREVLSQSENSVSIMLYASLLGWILASSLSVARAGVSFFEMLKAAFLGAKASLIPCAILVLAWSLKSACDDLQTGLFLVNAIGDSISPYFFPAMVFVVSGLTAFATGTSWGTMGILIPVTAPIAFQLDGGAYGLVSMMCFGAVLDGSILGDHCSPISDTTIMSSISSACDPIDHVRTQMPYSLFVGFLALLFGYLPAAYGVPSWVGISLGSLVILGVFLFYSPISVNQWFKENLASPQKL